MRLAALAFVLLAAAPVSSAQAQEAPAIGLAAPLSDSFERLGRQWADGVRTAARSDGAVRLVEADDACTAEGGAQAARQFVEAEVSMVVGFLCTPAIEAAMPILAEAGIPVLTPVRTGGLTDRKSRTGWPVYRFGPRADQEREAVAEILVRRWREAFFAIIDDGTIYGRELAESLRAQAELAELEPVFFDTFRPQMENQIGLLGRLQRAGATHVFVGGDRNDIAIMARDAEELGYDVTLAGGEALRAEDGPVPLSAGVFMIGLPRWRDVAAPRALAALEEAEILPEGYVLPGFAALELAAGAVRIAARESLSIKEALSRHSFETALGVVRFDAQGDLAENPYRLFRYDGEEFVEVE